ncbi:hypothetical protein [Microlunatus sp. Y2014]|uniref:hypothetical protein n=1 Tax=Microlunatus sp. Y2014 TaxID=3418488 RepID=UPI003DA7831F
MSMVMSFLLFQLPFLVFPLALIVASILAVKGSGRWLLAGGFAIHFVAGIVVTVVPFIGARAIEVGIIYSVLSLFRAVGWALVVTGVIIAHRHGNRSDPSPQQASAEPAGWQVPGQPQQPGMPSRSGPGVEGHQHPG